MQLAEMEARFKIHDLFSRYMKSVDNCDEAELFACFTEDGVLETPVLGGRFAGREGQRQFLKNSREANEGCQLRHFFTNLEVDLDGARARARHIWWSQPPRGARHSSCMQGTTTAGWSRSATPGSSSTVGSS